MNPVSIVTVKNKIPLFKGEEQANSIELIELEELGYEIVSQKDLYNVGDKAVYIMPDYSLSEIPLFESFIKPNGDEKKCRLGSNRRIRAIKFNLHVEGNNDPVYSNGILLPLKEVVSYIQNDDYTDDDLLLNIYKKDLVSCLGIVKWEEPEPSQKGGLNVGKSRDFPKGVYKTDEENINNIWGHLENVVKYPVQLVGSEKVDGSSITIGIIEDRPFICSRNLEKPLTITKVKGRRKKTFLEKLMFWKLVDLNIYEEVENNDDFTKYGKPYLDELILHGMDNYVFRGELNGGSMKGSGNKNNPSSKLPVNIKFFGVDVFESGLAKKLSYDAFKMKINYMNTAPNNVVFETPKEIFNKVFNSKEELLKECNDYFKENMIEGIVVRTLDSKFSAKVMSNEYDSKK